MAGFSKPNEAGKAGRIGARRMGWEEPSNGEPRGKGNHNCGFMSQ